MKKYWKIIVIAVFIVATISTYYIQTAIASKTDIPLKITTLSGNEAEIENITAQVSYHDGQVSHWLYITKDGVLDQMGRYSLDDFLLPTQPFLFKGYIADYRNFMREKYFDVNNFTEDEQRVAYVRNEGNVQKIRIGEPIVYKVDILEKQTKERSTFDVAIPTSTNYSWVSVRDVHLTAGELKFLVVGHHLNSGVELTIHTVDEKNQQLTHSETLATVNGRENHYSNIHVYNDENAPQNEQYYLYKNSSGKYEQNGAVEQVVLDEYYLYTISTGQAEKWELPKDLVGSVELTTLQGNEIFTVTTSANDSKLYRYDIKQKQWAEPLTISYKEHPLEEAKSHLRILEGKLHIIDQVANDSVWFIYDVYTGEQLFKGEIVHDESENLQLNYELVIEQLYVTK